MIKNIKFNRKNKIISVLVILIFCVCGVVYLILPPKNIVFQNINEKSISEIAPNLNSVNLYNRSVDFKLNEADVSGLMKSLTKFEKFKLEFKDNKVVLYIPTRAIKFIDTINTLKFDVSEENGEMSLKLVDAYLGKIKIPNSKVLNILSNNSSEDFIVDNKNEKIYIKNKFISFTRIEIIDDKLNISGKLNLNNIIDDILNKKNNK